MKAQTDWQHLSNARGAAAPDYEFDHETAARAQRSDAVFEASCGIHGWIATWYAAFREGIKRRVGTADARWGRTVSGLRLGLMQVTVGPGQSSSRFHADNLPLGI